MVVLNLDPKDLITAITSLLLAWLAVRERVNSRKRGLIIRKLSKVEDVSRQSLKMLDGAMTVQLRVNVATLKRLVDKPEHDSNDEKLLAEAERTLVNHVNLLQEARDAFDSATRKRDDCEDQVA